MPTLKDLFSVFGQAAPAIPVTGITHDSRRVEAGFVFVAVSGKRFDGHNYIEDAVRCGAVAIVGERVPDSTHTPHLNVRDANNALSRLAAEFHGNPSRELYIFGVTGTKGKTTTCYLIHHILETMNRPAGMLTTIGVTHRRENIVPPGHMTTPPATETHATLARMIRNDIRYAIIETSSHAIAQQRVAHVDYDLAVWTHLEPEHLDFHGDVETYFRTKARLVERAPMSVLNCDDPYARRLMHRPHVAYGRGGGQFRAAQVRQLNDGVHFQLYAPGWSGQARLPVIGTHNIENVLAAIAAVAQVDVAPADAVAAVAMFAGVPGRMQVVVTNPVRGIVDFAHTPGSLTRALDAARTTGSGRLIVVFGATGERDPRKRAPMGCIAMERADVVVLTEDDSFHEDLHDIMTAVERGIRNAGGVQGRNYLTIGDRREAIRAAVRLARPGDTVLLAGKGHERNIERGDLVIPWSDAAELRAALNSVSQSR